MFEIDTVQFFHSPLYKASQRAKSNTTNITFKRSENEEYNKYLLNITNLPKIFSSS